MNPIDPPSPHAGVRERLPLLPKRLSFSRLQSGIRGIALIWWVAICVTVAGASLASAQNVSLGVASFAGDSDRVAADWYWPLLNDVTYTYDGYGVFAGAIRTETFTRGESIAGVKAVRWHFETKTTGSATPEVEDWWLAFNVANDVCVLQVVQGGNKVFTASAQVTPQVWLPGKPVAGQKWNLLGSTLTVEEVAASQHAGGFLKLGIRFPDQPVEYMTYNAGVGVVQDVMNQSPRPIGSGWRLRLQ